MKNRHAERKSWLALVAISILGLVGTTLLAAAAADGERATRRERGASGGKTNLPPADDRAPVALPETEPEAVGSAARDRRAGARASIEEIATGPVWAEGLTPTGCAATIDAGDGSGEPGSSGNLVSVSLTNDTAVSSVLFDLADAPEVLTGVDCTSLVAGFNCFFTDNGTVATASLFSTTGSTIPPGTTPILQISYSVDGGAPAGAVTLAVVDPSVTSGDDVACTVTTMPGTFTVGSPGPVCGNGIVEGGEECDDGNTLAGDCCSATCTFEVSGSTCDDGLFCTTDDTCDGQGDCIAGPARSCDDQDVCTDDSCDEATDLCVNMFDPSNDPSCAGVVCGNGSVEEGEQCDDGNTAGGDCCAADCQFEPGGSTCEDDQFCSVGDQCDGSGMCLSGSTQSCDDAEICTDDSCDEIGNSCVNQFDPTNDPSCVEPVCGNGSVEEGEQCDDGNTAGGDCCAADCTFEPSGSTCEDDQFCSVGDQCDSGMCLSGSTQSCDDAEICTDDSCDELGNSCVNQFDPTNDPSCVGAVCGNGSVEEGEQCDDGNTAGGDCCAADCTFEPSGSTCEDGLFCTVGDQCDGAGDCLPGGEETCDDGDICTDDTCDELDDVCRSVFDPSNDPSCVEAVCGNGIVEESEECDDGNTDEGDCCSFDCTFEPPGESCDDGAFCTAEDVCDGEGACLSGLERDCDDGDICTDDSCDEPNDACVNEFDASNDPSCDDAGGEENPTLTRTTSCAFAFGSLDVCFALDQGAGDLAPGGPDEVTAIDWCIDWDPSELDFDCSDGSDPGDIPDAVDFFVGAQFATFVECNLEDPSCKLRFSIIDFALPFSVLPEGELACASFSLLDGAGPGQTLNLDYSEASASDTTGTSVPLNLEADEVIVNDCCVGDCNDDGRVDIADAVSIILEISDDDGDDFCDTQDDVPFDGVPCCDCNQDMRIDMADAVCVINGIGDLECPAEASALAAAEETAQSLLPSSGGAAGTGPLDLARGATGSAGAAPATPGAGPALEYDIEVDSTLVRVGLRFTQGADDGRPAGGDAITAFNACIDIDPQVLAIDARDLNHDGVPDAVSLSLPPTHVPVVRVDLGRPACEIQLGAIDLQRPSATLPSGVLAEIVLTLTGAAPAAEGIRPGDPRALSFADVLAVSHPGRLAAGPAAE